MTFLRWAPISPQRAPERKRGEGSTGANAPDRCRSVRIGGDGSEERRPRRSAHQPLGRPRRGDVLLAIVGGAAGPGAGAPEFPGGGGAGRGGRAQGRGGCTHPEQVGPPASVTGRGGPFCSAERFLCAGRGCVRAGGRGGQGGGAPGRPRAGGGETAASCPQWWRARCGRLV